MANDDIIMKVKALLKLGKSDNEHESATAIGLAAGLMERHAITEAMLSIEREEKPTEPIESWEDPIAQSGGRWKHSLAIILCKANGCQVYDDRASKTLRLVGRASNVSKVRYLYTYCEAEVELLTKRKKGNGRTWLNNYRLGCVDAIRKAVEVEREAARAKMKAECSTSALVPLQNAIALIDQEHELARQFGKKRLKLTNSGRSTSAHDPSARAQGRADGVEIYKGTGAPGLGAGHRALKGGE